MSDCDKLFHKIIGLKKAAGSGDIIVQTTALGNELGIPHQRVETCLTRFVAQGSIDLWARLGNRLTPFVVWPDPHEVFNSTPNGGRVTLKVLEEMPASSKIGF
jgi:hypothetical protein